MTERGSRTPSQIDQSASLSDEDVERRLGGGAGLGGPVGPRTPPPEPAPSGPRPPSRGRRLLWRDAGLALVLVLFLALGARFALNGEPTGVSATATPGPSEVALASASAGPTPVPVATPSPTPFEVIPSLAAPTPTPGPTPKPTPTPTLAPGATPKPTPKPTPATATLIVYLQVVTDNGGSRIPSDWTVKVSGANASPSSFAGTAAGRTVIVRAGASYSVSASGPSGYYSKTSGDCSGSVPVGLTYTCTITENDRPATVQVFTNIASGSISPSDVQITVTGSHVSPASAAGSSSGTSFNLDANSAYSVAAAVPAGYAWDGSSGCSGGGLGEGGYAACVISVSQSSTGPVGNGATPALLLLLLLPLVPPRRAARASQR